MNTNHPAAELARITGRDLTIPYPALCRLAGFTLTSVHLAHLAEAVNNRDVTVFEAIRVYATDLPTEEQYREMLAGGEPFAAPPAPPQHDAAAALWRALSYLDSYRDSEVVDDLEQARAILAQVAASAPASPLPTAPEGIDYHAETRRYSCRSCDYRSPTFTRDEDVSYEHDHATATGHEHFDLWTVTRSRAGVLFGGRKRDQR
ncbi:hypothetical protein ACWF9G_22750 [Nocardia sp. NPDC055029]